MGKRNANGSSNDEPPVKRLCESKISNGTNKENLILKDITGKQWKIGRGIGVGAFGEIFLASDKVNENVTDDAEYVAKIENHMNGPLFVEINCYLRIGKPKSIEEYKSKNNLKYIGMPHYVASGSYVIKDLKYRFLIIPRYKIDLEKLQNNRKLNLKTVLTICIQLLDVLKYIHSKGFIHADIKAANILLANKKKQKEKISKNFRNCYIRQGVLGHMPFRTCRLNNANIININLRSNRTLYEVNKLISNNEKNKEKPSSQDQIYLLDYGLASKYILSNGEHRKCEDQRRAHAGTILFCSLDAHKGILSRKSDLESLGYNIIYWLTGSLPWNNITDDPEFIQKKKERCMVQLQHFLTFCFGKYPKFLLQYFQLIRELEFSSTPKYDSYKNLFINALKDYGYKNDGKLDFDNNERWECDWKQKKEKENLENISINKIEYVLNGNLKKSPKKHALRMKLKNQNLAMLKWSRILMDPEEMLRRKVKERKLTESTESTLSISEMDIMSLKPTEAMLEVYNNYMEKIEGGGGTSPKYRGDTNCNVLEGYTPAMMHIYNCMMERRKLEIESNIPVKKARNSKHQKTNSVKTIKKRSRPPAKIKKSPRTSRDQRITRSKSKKLG